MPRRHDDSEQHSSVVNNDGSLRTPYSPAAERAVIGTVLAREGAFERVTVSLMAVDFHYGDHVTIFAMMLDMRKRSIPISLLTVREEGLRRNGHNPEMFIGSLERLSACAVEPTDLDRFVTIVKEYALRREIMRIGREMEFSAAAGEETSSAVVSRCYQELFRQLSLSQSGLMSVDKVMHSVASEIDERARSRNYFRGLRTSFPTLDGILQGYQPEQVYLFGAYSSVGKTAFALNTIRGALGAHEDLQVVYYSLEMSGFALGSRLLAIETGINLDIIRAGLVQEGDWDDVARASSVIGGYRKHMMINTRRVSIDHIAAECRALASSFTSMRRLIIVDYIQLVRARAKERPDLTLRGIAQDLLDLSKELYCPVIVFAQLNGDEMERPPDFRPWRRDLRDAKALADDARAVILMSRPWVHRKRDENYRECFVRLIIDKHSEGDASEDVDLHFMGPTQIIREENCEKGCRTFTEGPPFPYRGMKKKAKVPLTEVQRALVKAGFDDEDHA